MGRRGRLPQRGSPEGQSPFVRGLGVSPRYNFFPPPKAKGPGGKTSKKRVGCSTEQPTLFFYPTGTASGSGAGFRFGGVASSQQKDVLPAIATNVHRMAV